MNPHHAITVPLGMMRYEEDGEYVYFTDYAALAASHEKLVEALKETRGHLADYSRRQMWGSDGDEDVSKAQTILIKALVEAEKLTK
jgi:hypothetical protein